MSPVTSQSHLVSLVRWIARLWSIFTTVVVLIVIIEPASNGFGNVISLIEWLLVSLYAVGALGLLLGWWAEGVGGWMAIIAMAIEVLGFRLIKGMWYPTLFGFAMPLLLFVLPGALFLICAALSPRRRVLLI